MSEEWARNEQLLALGLHVNLDWHYMLILTLISISDFQDSLQINHSCSRRQYISSFFPLFQNSKKNRFFCAHFLVLIFALPFLQGNDQCHVIGYLKDEWSEFYGVVKHVSSD